VVDPEQAKPEAKAQRNFTDPDSRIMADGANKGSFIQAYNAQAAVDSQSQVIVAAGITQQANDSRQLVPMIEQVEANAGRKPEAVSADAGYWSEDNVSDGRVAGVDLYIATGRQQHGEKVESASGPPPEDASVKQEMQTNCGPRRGIRSTRCAKRLWNRSSVRSSQGAARFPPLQLPRRGQSEPGVEVDLPDGQSPEAVSLRLVATNRLQVTRRAISRPSAAHLARVLAVERATLRKISSLSRHSVYRDKNLRSGALCSGLTS